MCLPQSCGFWSQSFVSVPSHAFPLQVFVGPVASPFRTGLPVHVCGCFYVPPSSRCPVLAEGASVRGEPLPNGMPFSHAADWNRDLMLAGLTNQYPALLGGCPLCWEQRLLRLFHLRLSRPAPSVNSETLCGVLPPDAEGSLLFSYWPQRCNMAPPVEALVAEEFYKQLSSRRIFCLARGGPTNAAGRDRFVCLKDGSDAGRG